MTLTQDRLQRFKDLVAAAAAEVAAELPPTNGDHRIAAAYDQGRTDELNRILTLISVRLERLQPQSPGARELRLFRLAALEQNKA
jgi:hypothetical protein